MAVPVRKETGVKIAIRLNQNDFPAQPALAFHCLTLQVKTGHKVSVQRSGTMWKKKTASLGLELVASLKEWALEFQ